MNDDFSARMRTARQSPWLPLAIVALVAALFAVWLWSSLTALRSETAELQARMAELDARENTLADADRQLGSALSDLSSGHAGISKRIENLYGTRRTGLLAAEAEHLVRLAAQRLALMQDPAGAHALLAAADSTLREIRDADVHATRAALARDMARLGELSALDVEAAWLRLAALPDAVDTLAAAQPASPAMRRDNSTVVSATGTAEPVSTWDRFHNAVFSLISIRRVDEPVAPVVTADERALAGQNFRLLIEQAQLALLQRRAGIYRQSLERAERWLDRIAAGDPVRRARVRQELASLESLSVGQSLPDLSGSLAATRTLAARMLPDSAPGKDGATP